MRAGQKRALDQRVSAAAGPHATSLMTLFGRPIGWLPASGDKAPPSKKFTDFKALTTAKKAANVERLCRRRRGQEPYPVQKSRRCNLFADSKMPSSAMACPRAQRPSHVHCLNLTGSEVEDKGAGYVMLTPPVAATCMESADLILLNDLSTADAMPDEGDLLLAMLAAVAFGIPLVDKRTWQQEVDPFVSEASVRHVPSLEKVSMAVLLTPTFTEKHGRCTKVLRAASARPRSRWQVKMATDAVQDAKAYRIDCMTDVVPFIRRARRVLRTSRKVVGKLFPEPAAVSLISTSKAHAGATSAASDGRDTRSVRTSSGSAQLARIDTGSTRRQSLRALFGN